MASSSNSNSNTLLFYYTVAVRGSNTNTNSTSTKSTVKQHIELMEKFGVVLTAHLGSTTTYGVDFGRTDEQIYQDDMNLLDKCTVVVADITTVSLGVGFIIANAMSRKKPILCLCYAEDLNNPPKVSAMIAGSNEIKYYNDLNSYNSHLVQFISVGGRLNSEFIIDYLYQEFVKMSIQQNIKINKKIFLVGPPGSGKSTMGLGLSKIFGCKFISTGQLLRDICEISHNDNLSNDLVDLIKKFMDRGESVPADIMANIVQTNLLTDECINNGFILDGYPPSENDLQNLRNANITPDIVLYFKCTDETAISRQCKRNIRSTDNVESAQKRMRVFHEQIPELNELRTVWFPNCPIVTVDAEKDPIIIAKYLCDLIKNYFLTSRISYFPTPLYNSYVLQRDGSLQFTPDINGLKSTKFHFHIDAENQQILKLILNKLFTQYPLSQHQVKIYPIDKLHLGPQTKSLNEVYDNMMNFHDITDGSGLDETFVTGRIGMEFDPVLMKNVLDVARSIFNEFGHKIMVEVEQYFYEVMIGFMEEELLMDTMPDKVVITKIPELEEFNQYLVPQIPQYEYHLGFDIPKQHNEPICLQSLMNECCKVGMNMGGWFIFEDPNIWKYRSNEFVTTNPDLTPEYLRETIDTQAYNLVKIVAEKFELNICVNCSIEVVHGIWQF